MIVNSHSLPALISMVTITLAFGCRDSTQPRGAAVDTPARAERSTELRLVVVDDEPLAEAIDREWKAQSQGSLTITTLTRDQFQPKHATECDVVIFPTNWLGQLAEANVIRPLPASAGPSRADSLADYDWNDVFGLLRREELRWGGDAYAVSFGSPQLALVYRKDLLEQWELPVPTTWQQYGRTVAQVAKQIQQARAEGKLKECFATAEPLGEGWACRTLLARSAAYARHRSQYSTIFQFSNFEPLINRPPFVRGLSEMIELVEHQPPNALEMTPSDVMQRLLDGQLVMGITWPAARLTSQVTPDAAATLGFADLPGSRDVYHLRDDAWEERTDSVQVPLLAIDGRVGALSRRTPSIQAAANFLLWLTDRQQSERISTRSVHTTMFRQSQLDGARHWVGPDLNSTAQEYADVVSRAQNRSLWLMLLRVPGQQRYLSLLDESIRQGLAERSDPQRQLDGVAEQWSVLTNELGSEQQRKSYSKSLGIQ